MFQTDNRDIYYKREDDTWFVKSNRKKFFVGWRCIGSINLSYMLKEYPEDPKLIFRETCEQLQTGPPKDFIPYFKVGNYPLTIKDTSKLYSFNLGSAIIEVYTWI